MTTMLRVGSLSGQRHGAQKDSDMGHGHFLNSTGDKGNLKRERHGTLLHTIVKITFKL